MQNSGISVTVFWSMWKLKCPLLKLEWISANRETAGSTTGTGQLVDYFYSGTGTFMWTAHTKIIALYKT